MSEKDRYGKNIRRGGEVLDQREEKPSRVGKVVGSYDGQVVVQWEDGTEEQVRADKLKVKGGFGS
jgi:hypothetical protein